MSKKSKVSELCKFFVAGLIYADCDPSTLKLKRGDVLDLHREPHNPADADAIRIEHRGVKLGYVPAIHNDREGCDTGELRDVIDRGQPVRVEVASFAKTNPTHRMVLVRAYVQDTPAPSKQTLVRSF